MDYKKGKVGSGEGSYSVVLVVSPLVSLMVDQVTSLRERGVTAAIVSGHPGVSTDLQVGNEARIGPTWVDYYCVLIILTQATVSGLRAIKFSLLFTAPEAIVGVEKWRAVLLNPPLSKRVVAVAIDEAHCVSKW